ncbi:GNAT family N-acetyltransferase [Ruania zhangjianzhongii]|uniref:GNAT family N-acetyltransferase n=1 Tax=Ruania zhangjianzhongii TaxID=2603206 RepID=UPI0011C94FE0|nr:GNAT family protein [Ruania zhangjianzhongii]
MTFADAPTLQHAAVRLERLDQSHREDLAAAVRPGELWRTWYTAIPSPEGMAADIDRRRAEHAAGRVAPWAVIDTSTGTAVGVTTYLNLDQTHRRLEIGSTWLARRAQGTAINPATKLLLLRRAFDELGCLAVEFRTHWHNHQSRAAIARLGAKQDGVLRSHRILPDGSVRDTVVFSILHAEWPAVRAGLVARLPPAEEWQ